MTKSIEISGGRYLATIDDEDYERVSRIKWFAQEENHTVYARARVQQPDGRYKNIRLHELVMRLDFPDADAFDHIDGNGLNCTRGNLRPASKSQNAANRHFTRSNTGYKGVTWDKATGKYRAQVNRRGEHYERRFSDLMDAVQWRDEMAFELFREFAVLNQDRDGAGKLLQASKREKPAKSDTASNLTGVARASGYADAWAAFIRIQGKLYYLGRGDDEVKLGRMRDCAAIHYHGAKARLNFDRASYTDDEIRAVVAVVEEKRAVDAAARGVTSTLGIHYKVRTAA